MVEIKEKENSILFNVKGFDKIWALKNYLEISKEKIIETKLVEKLPFIKGLRMPGTEIPWVIAAGTYKTNEGWDFWDSRLKNKTIKISLRNHFYNNLFIDVENPEIEIQKLNNL